MSSVEMPAPLEAPSPRERVRSESQCSNESPTAAVLSLGVGDANVDVFPSLSPFDRRVHSSPRSSDRFDGVSRREKSDDTLSDAFHTARPGVKGTAPRAQVSFAADATAARQALLAADGIMQRLQAINAQYGVSMIANVGIDTGDVRAGILGRRNVSYQVWA